MGLKDFTNALQLFDQSILYCGEHHITYYNKGICQYHLKQFAVAIECFAQALSIKDDYVDAITWKDKAVQAQVSINDSTINECGFQQLSVTTRNESLCDSNGGASIQDVSVSVYSPRNSL